MEVSILLEYGWVLLVLIAIEGLLAADNARTRHNGETSLGGQEEKSIILWTGRSLCPSLWGTVHYLIPGRCMAGPGDWCPLSLVYVNQSYFSEVRYGEWDKGNERKKGTDTRKSGGFWLTVFKVEIADIGLP